MKSEDDFNKLKAVCDAVPDEHGDFGYIMTENGLVKFSAIMNKKVKCIVDHETTYLKYKHNYEVQSEDNNWYYFQFGDKTVKYPKTYFIEIYAGEQNTGKTN